MFMDFSSEFEVAFVAARLKKDAEGVGQRCNVGDFKSGAGEEEECVVETAIAAEVGDFFSK